MSQELATLLFEMVMYLVTLGGFDSTRLVSRRIATEWVASLVAVQQHCGRSCLALGLSRVVIQTSAVTSMPIGGITQGFQVHK